MVDQRGRVARGQFRPVGIRSARRSYGAGGSCHVNEGSFGVMRGLVVLFVLAGRAALQHRPGPDRRGAGLAQAPRRRFLASLAGRSRRMPGGVERCGNPPGTGQLPRRATGGLDARRGSTSIIDTGESRPRQCSSNYSAPRSASRSHPRPPHSYGTLEIPGARAGPKMGRDGPPAG